MTGSVLHILQIGVTLKAPYLVHGSEPGSFGLNGSLLRDHLGRLALPGTLISGRIRTAWQEMACLGLDHPAGGVLQGQDEGNIWFGQPSSDGALRARLWIDDLVSDLPQDPTRLASRVQIDADTGAAQPHQLMLVEQASAPNRDLVFQGRWRAFLTAGEAARLRLLLRAGLAWHDQLGALRSVGFGKLVDVQVEVAPAPVAAAVGDASIPAMPSGYREQSARLTLTIDQPICVSTQSRGGNVFESGDVISGGQLKGALATMLCAAAGKARLAEVQGLLAQKFDEIRFSHAFPASRSEDSAPTARRCRPSVLPQSLVMVGERVYDVVGQREPGLIDGQAPCFHHDWKHELRASGWGSTYDHTRVRTAIENGQSKDGSLFAYACKVAAAGTAWLADIVLPDGLAADEYAALWQALSAALAHGLGPIGKTDAWADIGLSPGCDTVWQEQPPAGPRVVLQLNTPALLFPTTEVADLPTADLLASYRRAFEGLSDGALHLSHFYASQRMAGGNYLRQRYLRRHQSTYQPLVLTEAGSVFVFEIQAGADPGLGPLFDRWRRHGLPLPHAVRSAYGDGWEDHPYLPQNGFGEIAVNLGHGFPPPPTSPEGALQ